MVMIGVLICTWVINRIEETRIAKLQAEGTLDPLDWFAKRAGQIVCPPSTVTNYIQLVEAFNRRFRSELLVPLRGEGPPYPRLFPVGEYFWLRSWDMAKDSIDTPVLWVFREPRETRVEYVTLGGEHRSEEYGRFVRVIQPPGGRVVAVGNGLNSPAGQ